MKSSMKSSMKKDPLEPIEHFRGEFAFLSNFFPSPITIQGIVYPTVEHAFQAKKTMNREDRLVIAGCRTPGEAKRMGRRVELRPDWDRSTRLSVMFSLLWDKFKDPVLRERLLNTAPRMLIEGNSWGDRFWGICDGSGENHLGELLMRVRSACRIQKLLVENLYCGLSRG